MLVYAVVVGVEYALVGSGAERGGATEQRLEGARF